MLWAALPVRQSGDNRGVSNALCSNPSRVTTGPHDLLDQGLHAWLSDKFTWPGINGRCGVHSLLVNL